MGGEISNFLFHSYVQFALLPFLFYLLHCNAFIAVSAVNIYVLYSALQTLFLALLLYIIFIFKEYL